MMARISTRVDVYKYSLHTSVFFNITTLLHYNVSYKFILEV
jgi:hypothetical protein